MSDFPAGIEVWLPRFDVGERHEIEVGVVPEVALARALAVPVAPDRLIRWLFRLRGLRGAGTIEQALSSNGFLLLERSATTWVVGLVAQGFRRVPVDGAEAWRRSELPRSLKIAADFRAEPREGGARIVTETRVAASDRTALLVFRLYWLLVGPFSKLIRRRWLRAAAAACAGSASNENPRATIPGTP